MYGVRCRAGEEESEVSQKRVGSFRSGVEIYTGLAWKWSEAEIVTPANRSGNVFFPTGWGEFGALFGGGGLDWTGWDSVGWDPMDVFPTISQRK